MERHHDDGAGCRLETPADALVESLFEATDEAIVNAVVAAKPTEGRDGIVAYGLPGERLARALAEEAR